jgi:hypothetical protein
VIATLSSETLEISHYLAALLHGSMTEVPTIISNSFLFASPQIMEAGDNPELSQVTKSFLQVRNILLAFADDIPVVDRIAAAKDRIVNYAKRLNHLGNTNAEFIRQLQQREVQAQMLCQRQPQTNTHNHAIRLLDNLATDADWESLESFSRRYMESKDKHLSFIARRKLILSLAYSDDVEKQNEAADLVARLVDSTDAAIDDYVLAITIFRNLGNDAQAKELLVQCLQRFPNGSIDVFAIGGRLVMDTGDSKLRQLLDQVKSKKDDQ